MFNIENRIWALLSSKKQEKTIERYYNRMYKDRDDCFIVHGIND